MTKTATIRQAFTPGLHLQADAMDDETPHPMTKGRVHLKACSCKAIWTAKDHRQACQLQAFRR